MTALTLVNQIDEEDSSVADSSKVSWSDPRVVVAIAFGLFSAITSALTFCGVIVGIYVVMQTKSATSEMSNAQLGAGIQTLTEKVDKFTELVLDEKQRAATSTERIENNLATIRRDLDREAKERQDRDGWLEARIVSGK